MSIERFFASIKDGGWRGIDDLARELGIQTSKLTKLSKLFSDYGLIKYEQEARRIRIDPLWKLLLPEEEPNEPKTIVATLIIPPQTTIDFQSTHISNISNFELEVTLRIDEKIKEVAIAA